MCAIWPRCGSTRTVIPAEARNELVQAPVAATTASAGRRSPSIVTAWTRPVRYSRTAWPVRTCAPRRTAARIRRGGQAAAVDAGRAGDVHGGRAGAQRREQGSGLAGVQDLDLADLGRAGPAGGQPGGSRDHRGVVRVAGWQPQGADAAVGHVGLAVVGQLGDQVRVLAGGEAAVFVPDGVVDPGGPRADDPGARRRGLARFGRVDQRDLRAQAGGGVGASGPDHAGAHHDQLHRHLPADSAPS